jgi:ubiquinone biosynthesis protein UbiJ
MTAETRIAAAQVRDLFARVERFDERARGIWGTYRFDVEGVGSWLVRVTDGEIAVKAGGGAADCAIACEAGDLFAIASGVQNLLTAMMQGRVRIGGDLVLAQRLHGFFRSAPEEERRT